MVKKVTKPAKAPAKKSRKKKSEKVVVTTPIGTFSYPNLLEPDSGRQYSDDKYKTDLLFKEKAFKSDPAAKVLREAILKVGRKGLKDPNATLSDFKHPLRRTKDMGEKYSENERTKDCIVIRAKTEYDPVVIDAGKNEMDADDIKKIKGGDEGRLVVSVFWYDQQGGGVALGLTIVQWLKAGEALGGGRQALIDELDEIEIEDIDDVDTDDVDDDEEEAPKRGKKKKKQVEEDDEEEEETEDDDSDDDDEPEESEEDDEDNESSDEEDEPEEDDDSDDGDDEEEEEKPKKKKVAAKSKSKSKPVKPSAKGKKKPAKDEDDEEEEDDDFSFDD